MRDRACYRTRIELEVVFFIKPIASDAMEMYLLKFDLW
jgi:hypothetical protein